MLPYTPLHHLLLRRRSARPLVMTSGNRSDEPIAYDDADAPRAAGRHRRRVPRPRPADPRPLRRLGRARRRRAPSCPVRRARGYAPEPIDAARSPAPAPLLAVGGQLKHTFALGARRPRAPRPAPRRPRPRRRTSAFDADARAALRGCSASRPRSSRTTCTPTTCRRGTRSSAAGAARGSACSTTTRTWRRAWPSTASPGRSSACLRRAGLRRPTARSGAASSSSPTSSRLPAGGHLRAVAAARRRRPRSASRRMALGHLDGAAGRRSRGPATPRAVPSRLRPREMAIVRTHDRARRQLPRASSAGRLFDAVAACSASATTSATRGRRRSSWSRSRRGARPRPSCRGGSSTSTGCWVVRLAADARRAARGRGATAADRRRARRRASTRTLVDGDRRALRRGAARHRRRALSCLSRRRASRTALLAGAAVGG